MTKQKIENSIPYLKFSSLTDLGFSAGFSFAAEKSPMSEKENMQLTLYWRKESGGDKRWGKLEETEKKLSNFVSQFGFSLNDVVECDQKHTKNVAVVTSKHKGKCLEKTLFPNTDGLITNESGILLSVNTADCAAIYFADPVNKAVGLCHSGRKGTFLKIGKEVLKKMNEEYGTTPFDVYVCISPMICKSCYEVGREILLEFENSSDWGKDRCSLIFTKGFEKEKYNLDLRVAIKQTLLDCSVPEQNIQISPICTCCNSYYFYSYRANRMQSENRAILGINNI
ncbi:MAG: peptidoglycan editing factor PgeF [Treponemataceae bacterium]